MESNPASARKVRIQPCQGSKGLNPTLRATLNQYQIAWGICDAKYAQQGVEERLASLAQVVLLHLGTIHSRNHKLPVAEFVSFVIENAHMLQNLLQFVIDNATQTSIQYLGRRNPKSHTCLSECQFGTRIQQMQHFVSVRKTLGGLFKALHMPL